MQKLRFKVTATHVSPKFNAMSPMIVTVCEAYTDKPETRYCARARNLGCSKDYSTPEIAVSELITGEAFTIIKIEQID